MAQCRDNFSTCATECVPFLIVTRASPDKIKSVSAVCGEVTIFSLEIWVPMPRHLKQES